MFSDLIHGRHKEGKAALYLSSHVTLKEFRKDSEGCAPRNFSQEKGNVQSPSMSFILTNKKAAYLFSLEVLATINLLRIEELKN